MQDQLARPDAVLGKGLAEKLGGVIRVIGGVYAFVNDVSTEDVDNDVGVKEASGIPTATHVSDVPTPNLIGPGGAVARRFMTFSGSPCSVATSIELGFAHGAIHRRQRTKVLSLVEEIMVGLSQAHVHNVRHRVPLDQRGLLLGAERDGRGRTLRARPAIEQWPYLTLAVPITVRTIRDAEFATGFRERSAVLDGFIDQLDGDTAILGADAYSFSPQIASAFFDKTSKAAASARAFSLRFNSFVSSRSPLAFSSFRRRYSLARCV